MPQVGPAEILVILLVGLIVFGPKRLPEIGRQVGRAMHEVKKFQDTVKGELDQVLHVHEDEPASAPSYPDSEAAIAAAEVPPALPPANGSSPRRASRASGPVAVPGTRRHHADQRGRSCGFGHSSPGPVAASRRTSRARPRRASGLPDRDRRPDPRPWR